MEKQPIHLRDAHDTPAHAENSYLDSFGGISPWLVGLVSLACGEVAYCGSTLCLPHGHDAKG